MIGPFDLTVHSPEQDLGIGSYSGLCAPDLQARHESGWIVIDGTLFDSEPVELLKRSNNEMVPKVS